MRQGSDGPSKVIQIDQAFPEDIFISIFPDRDSLDEIHHLRIISATNGQIPDTILRIIKVVDNDQPSRKPDYQIALDFSQDTKDFFLNDSLKQSIVRQAADDWAYFLADPGLDSVEAGEEQTYIWDDEWASGNWVPNSFAYKGFLLYAYGQDNSEKRSGGGASNHAFQHINGNQIPIRRSGGYHAEPDGNFNELGWNTSMTSDSWFASRNLSGEPHDLYSIALHEIGHALGFHSFPYPNFQAFANQGFMDDSAVVDYHGSTVPINSSDHLNPGGSGFTVDRISKKGAFGSEYADEMPLGRWLITKLSLLGLQAVGQTLRETGPFLPLSLENTILADGELGATYDGQLMAQGGGGIYDWRIVSGNLPDGLSLSPFNGQISGTPIMAGTFSFDVTVKDYEGAMISFSTTLTIQPSVAIDKEIRKFPVKIYPNPTTNRVWVEFEKEMSGGVQMVLMDVMGRPLSSFLLTQSRQEINLEDFPQGRYFLRFSDGEEVFYLTILKSGF